MAWLPEKAKESSFDQLVAVPLATSVKTAACDEFTAVMTLGL
jgi:hypothetical protein